MAWVYLVIASVFEICWIYSLKYLTWSDLLKINFLKLKETPHSFLISLLAFAGYIVFGVANVTFFSMSMKDISASLAFGVWMAISLIGSRLVDIAVFKSPYSHTQLIFMILIVVGIIGLKMSEVK
jgi:quaternary ammonium compound-resistance protein SugE